MNAPDDIVRIWMRFDQFPMETLTKAWLCHQPGGPRQRSVVEMAAHRDEYGTGGNCFDLAIWLLHDLSQAGIRAHAIGHDLFTAKAHVAVVAHSSGGRYLCDLGDQWLAPILIDSMHRDYVADPLPGFFPAAKVQVATVDSSCVVTYHRPSGKLSQQAYSVEEIPDEELWRAGHFSQASLRKPLCEIRVPMEGEIGHWEFYNWASSPSTSSGLVDDLPLHTTDEWCARIHTRTGIQTNVIRQALETYATMEARGGI